MSEILIEKEIIGYGPGTAFASVLSAIPIKPRTVKVFVEQPNLTISAVDDGAGSIVGAGISGTINYATGTITVSSTTAVADSSHTVFVAYTYFAYGVTTLNKVQYVAQDFQTHVEGIKTFLRENYPTEYNDFTSSGAAQSLIDIIAYSFQNLSWYLNRKVTDFYFPTARTPNTVSKIARMLGYKPSGATSAIVSVTMSLSKGPYLFPVSITKPFAFVGPNNLQYEYRGLIPVLWAPGDASKTIDLQEGKTTIENFVSSGETNQVLRLLKVSSGYYVEDGSVEVRVNGTLWTEEPVISFNTDRLFETNLLSTPATVKFGDGVQGIVPPISAGIEVRYVATSGLNGRIAPSTITAPLVPLNANFQQIPLIIIQASGSAGGADPEDLRSITVNAPQFQQTQDRAITQADYNFLASTFANVAKADAQNIRGVDKDETLMNFFSLIQTTIANLRAADRYLTPRPQIQTLSFSGLLPEASHVSLEINGTLVSQTFITDTQTTLTALAALIGARPNVASAIVSTAVLGLVIVVTSAAEKTVLLSDASVTGGVSPAVSVSQTAPAPNQVQVYTLTGSLFAGTGLSLSYAGVPVSVPFTKDTGTTLTELGTAIANFAKVPVAKITETAGAPHQVIAVKFDTALYAGNLIKIRVQDLSVTNPVDTALSIGFITDSATTLNAIGTALGALNFVDSTVVDTTNRIVTVTTNSASKVDQEVLAGGPGTTFSTNLSKHPIKPSLLTISAEVSGGVISGKDDGNGNITGTNSAGSVSGIINYATGIISVVFSVPVSSGKNIYVSYWWYDSAKTLAFSSVKVENNNVVVDTTAQTLTIATAGPSNLALTSASVSVPVLPALAEMESQSLISANLGSVAGLATQLEAATSAMRAYLEDTYADGCRANTVQVSVLAKDATRSYIAPPSSLLTTLQGYLAARADAVHSVVCVSGFDKVIAVDLTIEIRVANNAIEDDVANLVQSALVKSDAAPLGVLIERSFGKSLYVSDIFEAIEQSVDPSLLTNVNVMITGPVLHVTGLRTTALATGLGGGSQTVVGRVVGLPVVPAHVALQINGVTIASDNGLGVITAVSGSGYTVTGTINYVTGALTASLTSAPASGLVVNAVSYQNLIDARGNLICPTGYVLQCGNLSIVKLPRT